MELLQFNNSNISQTLLYILVGMGIVFAVLIVIAAIVGMFSISAKIQNKGQNNQVILPDYGRFKPDLSGIKKNSPVKQKETLEETQLIAVITAAVMAHLGDDVPKDGLIVRKIRRVR